MKGFGCMAEYCLDCWNEINETNDVKEKYIFTKDLDLCEGCGELKNTIIIERKYWYIYRLRLIIYIFRKIYQIIKISFDKKIK